MIWASCKSTSYVFPRTTPTQCHRRSRVQTPGEEGYVCIYISVIDLHQKNIYWLVTSEMYPSNPTYRTSET